MRTAREVQDELDQTMSKMSTLRTELDTLALVDSPTDGQIERSNRLIVGIEKCGERRTELQEELATIIRAERVDQVRGLISRGATEAGDGATGATEVRRNRRPEPDSQLISRALRTLDAEGRHLSAAAGDRVDELLRAGRTEDYQPEYIAERLLITETDAYRSAFLEVLTAAQHGRTPMLDPAEAQAMRAFHELERRYLTRAASEGTGSAGGVGVPVTIDPTIILTSGAADAPILQVCRIEPVTTNVWKGVSSAGMTWSYDAEGSEVSDDAATMAQPSINVYMPRGFIPYSIELGMDYPGFVNEMGRLLEQGYTDLLAAQTMTGSGSSSPRGIFTALAANTNVQVVTTTDGAFGGPDVFKAWNALPERYRSRATWVMSVSVESAIRQFAATAGSSSAYFTVDLTQDGITRINGRPTIVTDYAPSFAGTVPGTTGAANILCVGDFGNFVMANRFGMSVESVPLLVGSNRRPTGQRGIFAWARHGFDSANDSAFRLLVNQ